MQSSAIDRMTSPDRRLVVTPEYNGMSDEHVLAGASTAQEAKEIFQKWLDGRGLSESCEDVSAAEVYIGKSKTLVWLPNTLNRDQVIKAWRGKSAHLVRENGQLKAQVRDLEAQIKEILDGRKQRIAEAVDAATRPLERKIKRLKRATGRRK